MQIPFSPPYIDQNVIDEVVDTLNSSWITTGPKVRLFEREIANNILIDNVICVNSWTSGAMLVLKWFGVKDGDQVIIPAYTYSATALAVIHCGAIPVMVDITDDFTINVDNIKKVISSKTKVIMPVDIAGWPSDYDAINQLVNDVDVKSLFLAESENQKKLGRILVISDAAHSIGAVYKSKPVGSLTDITIFSFHAVKNITTAEGGAICLNLPSVFDNKEEYKLMKLFTLNGQNKDAFAKSQAGSWKYDILFAGLKINMPDVCAAIGLAQIKNYYSHLLKERERVAKRYDSFFSKFPEFQLPPLESHQRKSCFHLYAIRLNEVSEESRDLVIDEMTKRGIAVNVHFIPLPLLTLFKNLGYDIKDFPNSYNNYSREISLPIYPQLTDGQVDFICNSLLESYQIVKNK